MGTSEGETGYQIESTEDADNDLAHLSREIATRISQKINWLAKNASLITHQFLQHLPPEEAGLFKYRVGDYRILYRLNHTKKVIYITGIMNRKEEYRRLRR